MASIEQSPPKRILAVLSQNEAAEAVNIVEGADGWIANYLSHETPSSQKNVQASKSRISAPCLGAIPFQPDMNYKMIATSNQSCSKATSIY